MPTRRHASTKCSSSRQPATLKKETPSDVSTITPLLHQWQSTTMPPKGGSTKLTPPRLPPLPKLRVRRPNRPGENPCVGIMTSVLGTVYLFFFPIHPRVKNIPHIKFSLPRRMLGVLRQRRSGMPATGAVVEGLYGCAGTSRPVPLPERCEWWRVWGPIDWEGAILISVLGWVEQRPKTVKKNTINYHLMRLYPKIKGPTKQGK